MLLRAGQLSTIAKRLFSTKVHSVSLNSFNSNHSLYDKVRPSFDPQFVASFFRDLDLDSDKPVKLLELAAGTGKFTKELVNLQSKKDNIDLTVVEPSVGMIETFTKNYPDIECLQGSSYELPIEDDSVDVIIVAQGFHWFSDLKSLKEMYRVLNKSNGKLGLIWNFDAIKSNLNLGKSKVEFHVSKEDDLNSQLWQNIALEAHKYDSEVPQYRRGAWRDVFYNQSKFDLSTIKESFGYKIHPFDKNQVYDYWLSRSFIHSLPSQEQSKFRKNVEERLIGQPDSINQFLGTNYFVISVK